MNVTSPIGKGGREVWQTGSWPFWALNRIGAIEVSSKRERLSINPIWWLQLVTAQRLLYSNGLGSYITWKARQGFWSMSQSIITWNKPHPGSDGRDTKQTFYSFQNKPLSQSINVRTTFYAVMITVHGICWSNVSLGTCLYLKAFKLEVGSVLKSDKYHSNVQSLERRVLTAQNLQSTISSAEHKRVSSFPPIEIGLRFLSSYNSDFFFKTKLDLIWNFCPPKFTQ